MALRFGWLIAKGQFFSHKARASGMPRMKEIRSLQVLSLLHFAYSNCSVTAAIFNNITDSLAKPSTLCLVLISQGIYPSQQLAIWARTTSGHREFMP